MHYFKTTFTHSNYGFGCEVKHSYDVVFEIDEKEYTLKNARKFDRIAGEAAAKQIPKIDYHNTGLPLGEGWSSLMGDYSGNPRYTKLNLPWLKRKLQKPAPGKPVIACGYTVKDTWSTDGVRHYRAQSFYKFIKDPYVPDATMAKAFPELLVPRWKIVKCLPKEAQIVSGCGIAGSIDVISDITVGDLVKWNENQLKLEQYNYEEEIKKGNDDRYQNPFRSYFPEWLKKLGLPLTPA